MNKPPYWGNTLTPIVSPAHRKKLWKHFYDPAERWEQVCDVDIQMLLQELQARTGTIRDSRTLPFFSKKKTAFALFDRHHDEFYKPTYLKSSKATNLKSTKRNSRKWIILDEENAICLFVTQESGFSFTIRTAFRPQLNGTGVNYSKSNFRRYAAIYFSSNIMYNTSSYWKSYLEDCTPPQNPNELSFLIIALGYAQIHNVDKTLCNQAKEWIDNSTYTQTLWESLDWDRAFDTIIDAIQEDDMDATTQALQTFEHLVVIADVLKKTEHAISYCSELKSVFLWAPESWTELSIHAEKVAELYGLESPMYHVWGSVYNAHLQLMMQDLDHSTLEAQASSSLKPLSLWQRVMQSVQNIADIYEQLSHTQLLPISPQMDSTTEDPTVEIHIPSLNIPTTHWKMFVLDAEYPEGDDVSEYICPTEPLSHIWDSKKGETVLVVLVLSDDELPNASLEDILKKEGIELVARSFTPPT